MSCHSARWRTKIWQHGWNLLSFEFLALVTISVVICTTSNKRFCFYTWLFDEYNLFASGKTSFSLRLDKMEMKTKIEKRCFTFIFSFNFTCETKLDLCFEALDMTPLGFLLFYLFQTLNLMRKVYPHYVPAKCHDQKSIFIRPRFLTL